MLDLGLIRNDIDVIDKQIVELYEKRIALTNQVAEYKISTGKAVLDTEREMEKLEALSKLVETEENKHLIRELFSQIMSMSRKHQYRLMEDRGFTYCKPFSIIDAIDKKNAKVVYQGVEGAYSHIAMRQFFGNDVNGYNTPTWRDAIEDVKNGKADYAVLPIENSTAGAVTQVIDLIEEYDMYVVAETHVKVEHALLGLENAYIEDIKVVYSHPQALAQCEHYLYEHPSWQQISMTNTALSAKRIVEEGDVTHAAIASKEAGELFGLKVLKEKLNYNDANTTRFVIVGRDRVFVKDANKVSICVELKHEPGSLYNLLSHIIFNGLNMDSIESRPIEGKNWEYRFFIDFDGNMQDPNVIATLHGLEAESSKIKLLGNF